jgi:hypothetical protein
LSVAAVCRQFRHLRGLLADLLAEFLALLPKKAVEFFTDLLWRSVITFLEGGRHPDTTAAP